MDSVPVVTSIAQDPVRSTVTGNPQGELPVRAGMRRLRWVASVLVLGIGIGLVVSLGVIYLPYDRIVVRGQPVSPVISVSSAHLRDGGFVVLYLLTDSGWELAGHSGYLSSGYHRNIRIPIGLSYVLFEQGRSFLARIYRDTGNQWLSEQADISVNSRDGTIYQKHFWFRYAGNTIGQLWLEFLNNPVSFIGDYLIP